MLNLYKNDKLNTLINPRTNDAIIISYMKIALEGDTLPHTHTLTQPCVTIYLL